MDLASKIKILKEESQKLDDEKNRLENQIKELKVLVEEKKKKEAKIEELKKLEKELLANI